MADFNQAIQFVLKNEGGILHDPSTGEYSNFGITQKLLKDINYFILDPKDLVVNDAKNIYLQQFWNKYKFYLYKSDAVARKIFDMYVNMGPRQAGYIVQDALGFSSDMRDGIIGHHTLCEINEWTEDNLLQKIVNQSKVFYTALADGKPELAKYKEGWLKRAGRVA